MLYQPHSLGLCIVLVFFRVPTPDKILQLLSHWHAPPLPLLMPPGLLEMGGAYLPVDRSWSRYLADCKYTFEDMDWEMRSKLMALADAACANMHMERCRREGGGGREGEGGREGGGGGWLPFLCVIFFLACKFLLVLLTTLWCLGTTWWGDHACQLMH